MASRRQEKVARVIMESVSDTIANRLSDPRIEGLISITKVDTSPDLRNADVYLSILAVNDKIKNRAFSAIEHATRHIQARLSHKMTSKFCPRLHFHQDAGFKKTLDTLRVIDEVAREFRENDEFETEEEQ